MKPANGPTDSVDENVYDLTKRNTFRTIVLVCAFSLIGIMFNFPFSHVIEFQANKMLKSIPGCTISFDKIDFSFFLPKINIIKPILSSNCFGGGANSIALHKMVLSLGGTGISFSPLGMRLKAVITDKTSKIVIYPSLSFSKTVVKIQESKIDLSTLGPLLNLNVPLKGQFELDSLSELSGQKHKKSDLLLQSKNLTMLSTEIHGLELPTLKFNNFLLKVRAISDKSIKLLSLFIGDNKSPIIIDLKGDISVNSNNIMYSKLNLTGGVKFAKSILSDFPIIKIFLTGKTPKKGFYPIKITGTLASPLPSAL
jgi:hypothetical protein